MIPDYYKILNVNRNTTIVEIKKAYRKLALQWHPDVNKKPNAHEMFISINEASLILSDEEARTKYNIEYDLYFKTTIDSEYEFEYQSKDNSTETKHTSHVYKSPDLNNWTKSAKRQAEKYAFMSFSEFSKLVGEVIIESGKQGFNAVVYAIGAIIGVSGLSYLFYGIYYGDKEQIVYSLLFIGISFLALNYSSKKYNL